MSDARGSTVAAITWVFWKGRNRLQNLEATSRNFRARLRSNIRKTFGGTAAYKFQIFGTLDLFWKILARLKRPLISFHLLCSSRHNQVPGVCTDSRPRARWYQLRGLPLVCSESFFPQCDSSFVITRGSAKPSAFGLPVHPSRAH